MQPTKLGLMHFALLLAAKPAENEALWSKLPPLEGANKFHDLAPAATVLADAGPDKPLLVAHDFGAGRVMAFAGDSTWRWWMGGFESAHKRFWRQIVLWLARKDQTQEGSVWIRMAQRRFAPSQRVEFFVGATSPTGDPIADAEFKAEIVLPDGKTRQPLPLARQSEQMVGSFADTQTAGDYAIEVTASAEGPAVGLRPGAIPRDPAGLGARQRLGRRRHDGEPGRDDRRQVAGPRGIARTDPQSHREHRATRRAARDEEDVLGHLGVLPHGRCPAGGGVVS